MAFRFIEHTGDAGVRIESRDREELLADAARALLSLLVDESEGEPVGRGERRELELESEDCESLLVDFLGELIFRFDSERFLCSRLELERVSWGAPARLRARLLGETFDPERHVARSEVKAATFHQLRIERAEGRWRATVIFDL